MSETQPKDISVRIARPSDRSQIFQIVIDSILGLCSGDYTAEQIKALLHDNSYFYSTGKHYYSTGKQWDDIVFVAEAGEAIVGFSSFYWDWVNAVYVHPNYVRQGVATQLLRAVEGEAISRKIKRLSVKASITGQPFYQACGYQVVAQSSLVTGSGVYLPVIYMEKWLVSPDELEQLVAGCMTTVFKIVQWVLS